MTPITTDTICAISTPPGVGGIAVVRISGPQAIAISDGIWKGTLLASAKPNTAHVGHIIDPTTRDTIDQAVATIFHGPHSFTGLDTVELSLHGSSWIQRTVVQLLIDNGCRLAQPGEFTQQAFISGKLNLAEAEAVADLIASTSKAAQRIAMSQMCGHFSSRLNDLRSQLLNIASLLELELDFAEEHVEFASRPQLIQLTTQLNDEVCRLASSFATGHAIKNGIPTAIIGAANAGKSTLLNRILGDDRAIVSDIPGTTRDVIQETIEINGTLYRFIDTAGLRSTTDTIESLGIERTIAQLSQAHIVIWLIDPTSSTPLSAWADIYPHLSSDTRLIVAINKADLTTTTNPISLDTLTPPIPDHTPTTHISASTGQGVETLLTHLAQANDTTPQSDIIITNLRHYQSLTEAHQSLTRMLDALSHQIPTDLVAQDLRHALHSIGEITGTITTPEILQNIFSKFCIGK